MYTTMFVAAAMVAALFGFTPITAGAITSRPIANGAVDIARTLFFIFVMLFVASLVMGGVGTN